MRILQDIEQLERKQIAGEATAADRLKLAELKQMMKGAREAATTTRAELATRRRETRAKIILGAWVLHNRDRPEFAALMATNLSRFLSDRDREFLETFWDSNEA
jgi:hypothetical protein